MRTAQSRIELAIDIFEEKNRRALIQPHLSGRELIEAILQEFRSIAYLSNAPAAYALVKARNREALDPALPLGQQIKSGERIMLVEDEPRLPEGTQRPTTHAYLREEGTGKVYKLHWSPAIIGRPDSSQQNNEHIAVDLAAHPHGLRVSRRHAQITEQNGHYFIESLSQNQTTVRDAQGRATLLGGQKLPLEHGQRICLDQSQIILKFIVRSEQAGG